MPCENWVAYELLRKTPKTGSPGKEKRNKSGKKPSHSSGDSKNNARLPDLCQNRETVSPFARDLGEPTASNVPTPSLKMQTNGKMRRKGVSRAVQWQTNKEFVLDALENHERPLTAYAMRLHNGDEHAARDAVQYTFMQLCKQSPSQIGPKLAPWLFTVCRNRILDELKSKSRQATSTPPDFDAVDLKAVDPASQFERDDLLHNLRQLFSCLNEPERNVIELWSHGLNTTEISGILRKNPATVRVNLHRAIKRLKQHPDITNWLERATGQVVRPDVDLPKTSPRSTSKRSESATPSITGDRS